MFPAERYEKQRKKLRRQKADEIAHHEMCVADLEKNNATAEEGP